MLPQQLLDVYQPQNHLFHPTTEAHISAFVRYAAENKLNVRVRGAALSVPQAVFTDGFKTNADASAPGINLQLDQFRSIHFDESTLEVTVGAGINLYYDPFDPSHVSSETNGLFPQVAAKGWVLPNVPAVAHQTIAGFIATGSEGASAPTSFGDQVVGIRLIDGNGNPQNFRRSDDPTNPFFAVGTSLGLLGIVVSVTLKCLPYLDNAGHHSTMIAGYEDVTSQYQTPFNFLGPVDSAKPSLADMLTNTPHVRLLWWPYNELQWVVNWRAAPMSKADAAVKTGIKAYAPPFPVITIGPFHTPRLWAQWIAEKGFWLINNWPNWYDELTARLFGDRLAALWNGLRKLVDDLFPTVYTKLLSLYFSPKKPQQQFWDVWWSALQVDSFEFSNKLFNLDYTELWVPMTDAERLIAVMEAHYNQKGFAATEVYTVEISGAKASPFWMSPAYEHDVIRINFLHFANSAVKSADYYQQFWQLLHDNQIPFRSHWGKLLPPANGRTGAPYLAEQYPKLADFKELRASMDPHNVFLTSYWKLHLGI